MTLLEQLRSIGLPMRGKHHGSYISWTTDAGKAEAAISLGARVTRYTSRDEEFSGWDISCPVEGWSVQPSGYREVRKLSVVKPWEGAA